MSEITIVSFGYLHAHAPDAHLTLDARELLRDPHIDPAMRQMTGLDEAVAANVMAMPAAEGLLARLHALALDLLTMLPDWHAVVAIGCAGGRHRSVVLARELGERLSAAATVQVVHRDVTKPVVRRATAGGES